MKNHQVNTGYKLLEKIHASIKELFETGETEIAHVLFREFYYIFRHPIAPNTHNVYHQ